jgi:signal peptidase II
MSGRSWLILLFIIAAVLIVDQVAKRIVMDTMLVGESRQPIPALVPYFQITRSENRGAAFGFLPQGGDVFLIIAVVVVSAMIYFYPRIPANAKLTQIAIGLICGGALGNALDRLEHGLVVDFIHYQIPGVLSNVSNLADHAIVLGVFLIFIDSWLAERAKKRADSLALQPSDESADSRFSD